ncbi:MAG: glycerol-3-phosphate 1-O-acyltransferase PlsY [Neptuniibacter sp.]
MTESIAVTFGLTCLAYLWGSIPTAVIVCRVLGLPDPRSRGSGNPGTTNVLRIGTRQAAFYTLLGDFSKGYFAVLPCLTLELSYQLHSFCALAAILGHLFPVFTSFRGGKGVATTLGACLALFWPLALFQIGCWCLIAMAKKTSSLASVSTALLSPFFVWHTAPEYLATLWVLAAILVFSHRQNIRNILDGREPRL